MKTNDMVLLAAVGVGGFLLWKSNVFKGVADTTEAIGDAAGGLAGGIGQISGAVGGAVENVGDFIGVVEDQSSGLFQEVGSQLRSGVEGIGNIANNIIDIPEAATGGIANFFKGGFSQSQIPTAQEAAALPRYNPFSAVTNFVKTIVSKVPSPSITAAVIGSPKTSSLKSSSSTSTSSGGSSSRTITTSTRNRFLETIGYQGQSTATGISYSKPTFSFSSLLRK